MKTTAQGHAMKKHIGISFVTGETVEFYEPIAPVETRGTIIRRVLGWPTKGATMYPVTRPCEAPR